MDVESIPLSKGGSIYLSIAGSIYLSSIALVAMQRSH